MPLSLHSLSVTPSCSPCRDHRGPWTRDSRMWLDLVYKGWGCSVFKVPTRECFSLHMAGANGYEEVWPSSSLSFLLPQALSSASFSVPWCDWWAVKWLGFQRRERCPLDLQPKPQTSSLAFLALHHITVNGTLHVFAIILCNFTGKGSCLKVGQECPTRRASHGTVWTVSNPIFVELREFEVSVICEELKLLVKVTLVSTI